MRRHRILDDVRKAVFYSIIADEAVDSANDEQLAVSIRYVHSSAIPQELFLGCSECVLGVKGQAISEIFSGILVRGS